MTALPESLVLGQLPKDPDEAAVPRKSRARDFVISSGIKPHPTKRSFGILPDGREVPLSPSQLRHMLIANNGAPTAAVAHPAPSSLTTVLMLDALRDILERLARIEALLKEKS